MVSYLSILSLASAVAGQQVGTLTPETHPAMPISVCTAPGACTTEATKVTVDANWRYTHITSGFQNCYSGNQWNTTACPDPKTCAANCALDGADYAGAYGVTTPTPGALKLSFVTKNANGVNVGSRLYLMAPSDTEYRIFNLLNQEFSFDVDVSKLPCGLNGALYFVAMDADGGVGKFPTNKAGAKFGTGYCDAQCPHDIKFINGEANVIGWNGTGPSTGAGQWGACCPEMDIWEANSLTSAYTPHPCTVDTLTRCEDPTTCGDGAAREKGLCDKSGCDFNSFRMGDKTFYGPGLKIDTAKPITVVTQFITADGTATGALTAIKRFYKQGGALIPNSAATIAGIDPGSNSITDGFCAQQKVAFGDPNDFKTKGGLAQMGKQLAKMVLVLSIWDDTAVGMKWLDSVFPDGATNPGALRGPCAPGDGLPATVEAAHPDATVIFSNIKIGPLNSTTTA